MSTSIGFPLPTRTPSSYISSRRNSREKFEAGFVFNDWLDEHGIPYEFFNWYSPDEG